jgi:hypothetical protein
MGNEGQRSASFPYRPFHVYANIGDEDNLISVRRFATRTKAEAWMFEQKKERPDYPRDEV